MLFTLSCIWPGVRFALAAPVRPRVRRARSEAMRTARVRSIAARAGE